MSTVLGFSAVTAHFGYQAGRLPFQPERRAGMQAASQAMVKRWLDSPCGYDIITHIMGDHGGSCEHRDKKLTHRIAADFFDFSQSGDISVCMINMTHSTILAR